MFTGIIESTGKIISTTNELSNKVFEISCAFTDELKIDQSIAHNGVCLTVTAIQDKNYFVTAIQETLLKTNLGRLKQGDKVNLERCMPANGRFDGHIVQGHVDQTGICTSIKDQNGSWVFEFDYDPAQGNMTVEKGSICINGVSLTVVNSSITGFSVAIIPYTFEHTTFNLLKQGDVVNLEFDIIGKYIKKLYKK